MKLQKKECFKIYARKAITEKREWCLFLEQGKRVPYADKFDFTNCISFCEENLLLTENEENDWICIRPIEIEERKMFSIVLETKETLKPVLVEILPSNFRENIPREIIVINHSRVRLLFQEKNGVYEITYIGQGMVIDSFLNKVGVNSFTPTELAECLEKRKLARMQEIEEKEQEDIRIFHEIEELKEQLKKVTEEQKEKERSVIKLKEVLRELQNSTEKWNLKIRQSEAEYEKKKEIMGFFLREIKVPVLEREQKLKSCQKYLEFLEQVGVHYQNVEYKELLKKSQECMELWVQKEDFLKETSREGWFMDSENSR